MSLADDPRIVWESCDDETQWTRRAAATIAGALRAALAKAPRATLLLSGGATPLPVYRALARADLDWPRVVVGLADERDVGPDADGSNERLVRAALAARVGARFRPLRVPGRTLAAAAAAANADPAIDPAGAVVVLGMGEDGHVASLFPGARDLDAALATAAPYATVDATGCPGAGRFAHRLSLTARGIAAAAARVLLLRGAAKRATFARALAPGDARELPVRVAVQSPGRALQVLWCAQ